MILYFLKQSLRQIFTNIRKTLVQVIGLGIGLGSVILMLVTIIHEYSFDKYHRNCINIYRVIQDKDCSTPYIMGDVFKEDIPEIGNVFRIYPMWNVRLKKDNDYIREDCFMLADSSIFTILDIPLFSGNRSHLMQGKNDIVISDQAAKKYFEGTDPVGKSIEISISGNITVCNITGVFRKFPSNSSFRTDFIGNIKLAAYAMADQIKIFSTGSEGGKDILKDSWNQVGFQTFLLLAVNPDVKSIEKKADFICQKNSKEFNQKHIHLQKYAAMYFHSEELWNFAPFVISNLKTLRMFEGIAILVLIIACFNYVLLSTAETRSNLKGIACRKVIGASSGQIAMKIYVHSILISILSLIPALIFISLILPYFNQLFDKNISIDLLGTPVYLVSSLGVALITGILGGVFISVYSARLSPVNLFKPTVNGKGITKALSSGGMIVFQFAVFILLLSAALIVGKQVRYSEGMNQGFNTNNVAIIKLNDVELRNSTGIIKTRLLNNPHIVDVAASAFTPPTNNFIQLEIGKDKNSEPIKEEGLFVGDDLIELLQIPVLEGKTYKTDDPAEGEFIINQTAAEKYHVAIGDPLGSFKVRGIVKDFHLHSMHRPIEPLFILKMNDEGCYELAIRSDGNNKEAISAARKVIADIMPSAVFDYQMLNDRISSFYQNEKKQIKTISFFTVLAILLSIMGMIGFVSMKLQMRTKEIGIRKVNGARMVEILVMFYKDFVQWVFLSFIIGCPVAWFATNKWLQNFAYKTALSWWVFLLAGTLALVIALLTVSWQSWQAARKNPVEALRYE
jgi:putative ABC transport system permease protein